MHSQSEPSNLGAIKTPISQEASGLAASKMNANQFDALMALWKSTRATCQRSCRRPGRADKQSRSEYPRCLVGRNQSCDPHYYRVQTASS